MPDFSDLAHLTWTDWLLVGLLWAGCAAVGGLALGWAIRVLGEGGE